METSGFGSGSSQKWIPSCLSVYVSWKGDRMQKDGPEDVEGCFCVVACATVRYSTDVICFRNCCRDVMVYCALWRCVYSLLDVMCILCTVALCL